MSVVKRAGILDEERRLREVVSKQWRPFPTLKAFLADHYPQEWEAIQRCGMAFRWYESRDRPGHYKPVAYSCNVKPLCIRCVRNSTHRRVQAALDRFSSCTPAGKPLRFIHIVQTAPIYHDGRGWGGPASRDVPAFLRLVWKVLVKFYGDGIGALLTYQDFGERAFAKRHPHVDLTLNGWTLEGPNGMVEVRRFELARGGRQAWDHYVQALATAFDVEAGVGSVEIQGVTVGIPYYYRALRYQLRELVDLRKLEYERSRQVVHWSSYRENRKERFSVDAFIDGLAEYQRRLGQWLPATEGGQNLHRAYGHMSDRRLHTTETIAGGAPVPHRTRCPCSECGPWDRVFPGGFGEDSPLSVPVRG